MTPERASSNNFINIFNVKESSLLLPKTTYTISEMEYIVDYFYDKNIDNQPNPIIKRTINLIDKMKDFWIKSDPAFINLYPLGIKTYTGYLNEMHETINQNKLFLETLKTPSHEKTIFEDAIQYCSNGLIKRRDEIAKLTQEIL